MEKSLTLSMMLLILGAVSIIAWQKIDIKVLPEEAKPPFVYVNIDHSGVGTSENMEALVTIPVEKALRTLSGVKSIDADSNSKSASFSISMKPGTDMELTTFVINEIIQDLDDKKIIKHKNVKVYRFNPEASAIIKLAIGFSGDSKSRSSLLKKKVLGEFKALPGISKAEIKGAEPLEYRYSVPLKKIQESQVKGSTISKALDIKGKQQSIGFLPLYSYRNLTSMRFRSKVGHLDQVTQSQLKKDQAITLENLSTRKTIDLSRESISHKNGSHSVFIELYQGQGASIFKIEESVKDLLQRLPDLHADLKSIEFEFILNQSQKMSKALDSVFQSLYMAVLITAVVVLIFLRRFMSTLILALVIPFSLLIVVALLHFFGDSLNILTLSGLILSVGLIVDNAIVVIERIEAFRNSGQPPKKAAATAAYDVSVPLLMSTLTTIVIFLPASFIEGGDTFTNMLKSFQKPVIFSLTASYIVALLFVPIASLLQKNVAEKKNRERKSFQGVLPSSEGETTCILSNSGNQWLFST